MASSAPTARPSRDSSGLRARLTIPVLAYCGILMAVMQTVVVPLLPDLPRLTGASASAVSWMVTASLLAGAVLTPSWAAPVTCTANAVCCCCPLS